MQEGNPFDSVHVVCLIRHLCVDDGIITFGDTNPRGPHNAAAVKLKLGELHRVSNDGYSSKKNKCCKKQTQKGENACVTEFLHWKCERIA